MHILQLSHQQLHADLVACTEAWWCLYCGGCLRELHWKAVWWGLVAPLSSTLLCRLPTLAWYGTVFWIWATLSMTTNGILILPLSVRDCILNWLKGCSWWNDGSAGDDNTFIGFAKNAIDIVQCRMKPAYLEVTFLLCLCGATCCNRCLSALSHVLWDACIS